ncbi:MAG TPA: LptF/LptG family permease, partial [Candidatus Saccharimonadales bacterium]|nr:LptF/LptG family permease [Candidatus Saccharimonadales bacterium]
PVALAVSCLIVALAEQVSPRAQLALAAWWRATAPGPADRAAERLWFRTGEEIVGAERAAGDGRRLDRVVIYRRGADGLLQQRLSARAAEFGPDGWRLRDAWLAQITERGTERRRLGDRAWNAPLPPGDIRVMAAAPLQVSAADCLRALQGRAGSDQSRGYLLTRLHRAVAEPLAPLVMLLLALPLAKATSRPDLQGAYLAWALLGGLVYVVADGVLTAAAQTGLVPAWFGAWLTPLVFAVLATTVAVFRDD